MNELTLPGTHTLPRPSFWNGRTAVWLAGLLLVGWSVSRTGIGREEIVNSGGWGLAWRFVAASVTPETSPDLLLLTADATRITLAYAVCGTLLSLLIGLVGGLLSSEVWWQSVGRVTTGRSEAAAGAPWLAVRAVLAVPRAIHEAVWGLIFINILGLNPVSAILALAIPFGAITAKVFSEILDETPRGPLHALRNSGVAPLSAFFYTILPQALPDLLGYTFYRFECAIRSATILGLIGAGGLGYQILLSLQSLRYEQMWTFLYALVLLCAATDLWSSRLRWRLNVARQLKVCTVTDGQGQAIQQERSSGLVRGSLIAAVLLAVYSFWTVGADWTLLWSPRSQRLLGEMAANAFPPPLDLPFWTELGRAAVDTLAMSLLAGAVAGVGGILLAFPAGSSWAGEEGQSRASLLASRIGKLISRGGLLLTRSIAEPIWALLAMFVFFPGIVPGAVGLGLYNLGVLGRLDAEAVENLDPRPTRALLAQGATSAQTFWYGVWPQALPRFIGFTLYRWEVTIRATVVVGLVGAGGLGRLLQEQLVSFDYPRVTATMLVYFLLTTAVDIASVLARRALR